MGEKIYIKNRKGQKISVLTEIQPQQKGIAFIMHGLGGFKEQPHLQTIAEALMENSYSVVRFDTTNTIGESDGAYEDATTTNYYEDLEDVIDWAETKTWYREPFILTGHSLGGICTALYAENYPDKVAALAPISTVVSGQLSVARPKHQAIQAEWQRTGYRIEESISKPGVIKKLKWSHVEDRLKYDLLPKASRLTMPVLLIVGENDDSTPPKHQQILLDVLPGPKQLHIIKNAPHTFRDEAHLDEIKKRFSDWLKNMR